MTTASGLSGFAILVSPNHLNPSSASVLQSQITALQGWNNASVNAARVASWMGQLPAGSYLNGKYLATELAKPSSSDRAAYWNAMLALKENNQYVWVAFDSGHMCQIRPGYSVVISGQTYKIATVYLPHKESCMIMIEIYDTAETVSDVAEMDGEVNWNVMLRTLYDLEMSYSALEARVRALEG